MSLTTTLDELAAHLRRANVEHALIGGLALAAHGAARATGDVDLLIDGARSEDVHELLESLGYDCLHRNEHVANYASDQGGRVDLLFARQEHGHAMLRRAAPDPSRPDDPVRVVDAADLIGLKVQSSANDPRRSRLDLADIQRLLTHATVDLARVRMYFRIFERETELDDLLEEIER